MHFFDHYPVPLPRANKQSSSLLCYIYETLLQDKRSYHHEIMFQNPCKSNARILSRNKPSYYCEQNMIFDTFGCMTMLQTTESVLNSKRSVYRGREVPL
jgi:hypothetical protein